MRSITALLVFSVVACHDSSDVAKDHPLAIPAGDDGRPALPSGDKTHEAATTDRTSVMVAWHEQLAKARVRFESLKARANEQGQKASDATHQLVEQTKNELDSTESKVDKADQVAAADFDGLESSVAHDMDAIEAHLKALEDSISGDKTAAASLEVEEDHE
jgi:uncharacterized phage infection (PIP) family protein YhgE